MHVYEKLGVRPLINARSFSTKAGGCALPKEVLDAMREAGDCCVRMDELQAAASDVIARATGIDAEKKFSIGRHRTAIGIDKTFAASGAQLHGL